MRRFISIISLGGLIFMMGCTAFMTQTAEDPDVVTKNTASPSLVAAVRFEPAPGGIFSAGEKPSRFPLSAADFDGDGYTDLAVHQVLDKKVVIYQGNPAGRLEQAFELDSGGWGIYMASGEVTGDGKIDLLTARTECRVDDFLIMINTSQPGTITFEEPETVFLGSPDCVEPSAFFPSWVTIADFTKDGHADLAVTGWWVASGKLWHDQEADIVIVAASGDGQFEEARYYGLRNSNETISDPRSLIVPTAAGDFNEDGYTDIAADSFAGVRVSFGKADGFHSTTNLLVDESQSWEDLIVEDINGDHHLDIVVLSTVFHRREAWPTLWILLGDGKGNFTQLPPVRISAFQTISEAGSLVSADFNRDGLPDLAASSSGQVAVLYNQGEGRFACSPESALSSCERFRAEGTQVLIRRDVQPGDFNGDGQIDLAYSGDDGKIRVLLNRGLMPDRQAKLVY